LAARARKGRFDWEGGEKHSDKRGGGKREVERRVSHTYKTPKKTQWNSFMAAQKVGSVGNTKAERGGGRVRIWGCHNAKLEERERDALWPGEIKRERGGVSRRRGGLLRMI